MKRILVTGGAGYIGSHTCKALAKAGYEPVTFDNLSRGHRFAVKWGPLVVGDIRDAEALSAALATYRPEGVIHFAALAYVGESVENPSVYYDVNVAGTRTLLEALRRAGDASIVFSSSCATYGMAERLPITEDLPQAPINPYGRTKLIGEQMLADFDRAHGLRYAALRYFNAAGADTEGELGEHHDPETHLIPRALMAAAGTVPALEIFGGDYPTPDGTCIRDFIHVDDLADAHVRAIGALAGGAASACMNLGTGHGISIREILTAIADVTGREVPTVVRDRRPGDPPELYADASRAFDLLGFKPLHSNTATIIETAWRSMMRSGAQAV